MEIVGQYDATDTSDDDDDMFVARKTHIFDLGSHNRCLNYGKPYTGKRISCVLGLLALGTLTCGHVLCDRIIGTDTADLPHRQDAAVNVPEADIYCKCFEVAIA